MLLGEPNRTDFDLAFRCFGIPVRVHPGFWAIAAILSLPAGREPLPVLGFALAIFLSILIHEMGHALAFRKCGIQSHVVLYHFGGLAVPDSVSNYVGYGRQYSSGSKIFVTAMGPGVQMLSAILLILLLRGMGKTDGFLTGIVGIPAAWTADPVGSLQNLRDVNGAVLPCYDIQQFPKPSHAVLGLADKNNDELITRLELMNYEVELEGMAKFAEPIWKTVEDKTPRLFVPREMLDHFSGTYFGILDRADRGPDKLILWEDVVRGHFRTIRVQNEFLSIFCFGFIQIGLFWAVMNLIPVYPLDGGQIARELFVLSRVPDGVSKSLMLSIVCGALAGLIGLRLNMMFIAIMFFFLAYSSYQMLQRMHGRYF